MANSSLVGMTQTLTLLSGAEISAPDSKVKVWVIPTNEELAIARDTLMLTSK